MNEHARHLRQMIAHLRLSERGTLLMAATPDRDADQAIAQEFTLWLQDSHDILTFTFQPEPVEQLSLSAHLRSLPPPQRKSVLFVFGLDELSPTDRITCIDSLNWGRERLAQAGYSVVLWVRPHTLGELGLKAPDFFSWRSGVFAFDLPTESIERSRLLTELRLFAPVSSVIDDLRQRYRDHVIRTYQWLDFRGLLQMRNVVRVPLADVFVPLQATTHTGMAPLLEVPRLTDELDMPRRAYERPIMERRVPLNEAIQHHQRFVVLGDPGSGKSTFLRFLALTFAQGPATLKERLGLDEDRLPILVPLSVFSEARREQPDLALATFCSRYFLTQGLPDFSTLFADVLGSGHALVLLDGLDEMLTAEARAAVIQAVIEFTTIYPTTRVVITSRLAGYATGMLPASFSTFTLAPFDADDIKRFARQWSLAFEAIGLAAHTELPPDACQRATLRAESLTAAATSHPGIQRLATNPLLLTLLALIHHQGTRLPHRRSELYRLCVEALAETWNLARSLTGRPIDLYLGNRRLDEQFVVQTLAPVAYWMHEQKPTGVISRAELEARIAAQWSEHDGLPTERALALAHDFVSLAREQMGLLVERAADEFSFLHLSVQEYLAARFLVGCTDTYERVKPRLHLPRWREVILLTTSCLPGQRAAQFVENILNTYGPFDSLVARSSALREGQKNSSVVDTLLSLSMLTLAARCLGDEVAMPLRLRRSILETLFTLWRNPPFWIFRWEIERIFLSLNDQTISDDLLAILRDRSEDASLHRDAARALSILGLDHPEVLSVLLSPHLSEDNLINEGASLALGSLHRDHPEAFITFHSLLHDRHEYSRASALEPLRYERPAIEALLSNVSDLGVREEIFEALWHLLTSGVWNPVG